MPSEESAANVLKKRVGDLGGWAFKLLPWGVTGLPDYLVILPGGIVWFIETKASRGRLRPRQRRVQDKLLGLGCNVATLWAREQVNKWYLNQVTV